MTVDEDQGRPAPTRSYAISMPYASMNSGARTGREAAHVRRLWPLVRLRLTPHGSGVQGGDVRLPPSQRAIGIDRDAVEVAPWQPRTARLDIRGGGPEWCPRPVSPR
jgi:hypothetical protein